MIIKCALEPNFKSWITWFLYINGTPEVWPNSYYGLMVHPIPYLKEIIEKCDED